MADTLYTMFIASENHEVYNTSLLFSKKKKKQKYVHDLYLPGGAVNT